MGKPKGTFNTPANTRARVETTRNAGGKSYVERQKAKRQKWSVDSEKINVKSKGGVRGAEDHKISRPGTSSRILK